MTLTSCSSRPLIEVESTTRKVCTTVSTSVARDDALEEGVALVRPDVLGALELDRRLARAHAEDHVDFRVLLQGGGDLAAPEGVETRDEDAAAHAQPNHTLARLASMS